MQAARQDYFRAKLSQNVTTPILHELASALLAYYDVLWEHKPKRQDVKQAWEESNVDEIRELADQERIVQEEAPGDTHNGTATTMPALMAADPEYLVALSKELDSLASDLGFTAGVEKDRPMGKVGDEDLWADHADAADTGSDA
jgi:hypothetical protein